MEQCSLELGARLVRDAGLCGLGSDAIPVDATPVVVDADAEHVAVDCGGERQRAASRLVASGALVLGLEAVVDRVAYDVHEVLPERRPA